MGKINITNRHFYTNLNEFELRWVLSEDGTAIQNGTMTNIELAPYKNKALTIPFTKPVLKEGAKYWLRLSLHTRSDESWAQKGHEIAKQQFEMPFYAPVKIKKKTIHSPLTVQETEHTIKVKGKSFSVEISKTTGLLQEYTQFDQVLIESPLKPNFWRPALDNDDWANYKNRKVLNWKSMPDKLKPHDIDIRQNKDNRVIIRASLSDGNSVKLALTYSIRSTGEVDVNFDLNMDSTLPDLVKIGMTMHVKKSLQHMTLYAKGPFENYSDRKAGADVDIYTGKINDFIHPYVRPQENGNHTHTEWLTLTNAANQGLMIDGKQLLSVAVWPWTAEMLANAKVTADLIESDFSVVNIDLIQSGVGGSSPGGDGARAIPKYHLKAGAYQYQFTIKPLN